MLTELHRHLDLAIRPATFFQLTQEKVPHSTFEHFALIQKLFHSTENLERILFEALEDAWLEGIRSIELRYSPVFIGESLPWDEVLATFHKGLKKAIQHYPLMKAGLICTVPRTFGPELADQVVDFFLAHFQYFIGIDLAGSEKDYPNRLFENSFKKVIQQQGKITIHAGEFSGPDTIWEAIELLGAHRIGHGLSCLRDPLLINHCIKKKICLEICPTSNVYSQAVSTFSDHPLPQLLRQGVPVSINTDDPTFLKISLPHEIQLCQTLLGLTPQEIQDCETHAQQASFLNS